MTVVNDQARTGEPAMSLTSVEVRDQLESLLERDLLGPWDGPEEKLPSGTSPAERYLLGRLVPHAPHPGVRPDDTVADSAPETVDREIVGVDHDDEDDVEPEATVRAGSMAASSLGLSFSVGADIDVITVTASWGRYERRPSETQQTEHGRPRTVWHRVPAGGTVEVRLDTDETGTEVPDPEQDGVVVRHKGARRVVDLALVNA